MKENIIILDHIRIDRQKPRKCTCEVRKFTVDTVNREIECSCGITVDPFEAMLYLANNYERINQDHEKLHAQAQEWVHQKPYSVLFKELERGYQRGKMLPRCPECEQAFDFDHITSWVNAEFFRQMRKKGGVGG